MTHEDAKRPVDKECAFTKSSTENKITGVLSVYTDRDNEVAVTIGGSRMLSSNIPGIQYIHLERDKGILYNYEIHVYGRCPAEYKSMEMFFKDGDSKVHKVTISSDDDKWHNEKYNSQKPDLSEITWTYNK